MHFYEKRKFSFFLTLTLLFLNRKIVAIDIAIITVAVALAASVSQALVHGNTSFSPRTAIGIVASEGSCYLVYTPSLGGVHEAPKVPLMSLVTVSKS